MLSPSGLPHCTVHLLGAFPNKRCATHPNTNLGTRMRVCSFSMYFETYYKKGGNFHYPLYTLRFCVHRIQGFSITVLVKITISVTFPSSTFTVTNALPVVFWDNMTIAVVAFIVTVPSASTIVLMMGLTSVML